MTDQVTKNKSNKIGLIIVIASILVPLAVAGLYYIPVKPNVEEGWIQLLPHVNAIINTLTTLLLATGFVFIKSGNVKAHKASMSGAFLMGTLFLVFYILYHTFSESTVFGDLNGNGVLELSEKNQVGNARIIYLVILLSHIFLAALVVPFVLLAFYFALSSKFERHKKIVKITLPVWLFVSISGVIVYLMISPYYN